MSIEHYPSVSLPLPNGLVLEAVAIDDANFPAINLYLLNKYEEEREQIAFVEFNPERGSDGQVCIGAYADNEEDTVFYEPYHREKISEEGDY